MARAQLVSTAPGVTLVARDRPVNSLTVPCPQCRVDVGDECETRRPGDVHPVRRRMAVRLLNEAP